ncbi:MAG: NAD-dependent epimerase/dehydratase family protein [bacterium]
MGPDIETAEGDLTDPDSVREAVRGCSVVYHAGGLPEQWLPDSRTFFRVNRDGTSNVLEAVRSQGGRRLVYTSTIDVFAADRGETFEERELDEGPKPTPYEQSKLEADRLPAPPDAPAPRGEGRGMDDGNTLPADSPASHAGPGPAAVPDLPDVGAHPGRPGPSPAGDRGDLGGRS